MPELVITRGLPASGKTTWAREWVAQDPTARGRANRDDLRASMFGQDRLDYAGEQAITAAQVAIVRSALTAGRSVVVDDTNLRLKFARAWADLARDVGAKFLVQDFLAVPVETCIERDTLRFDKGERHVGETAIRALHMKFLNGRGLPEVTASDAAPSDVATYTPGAGLPDAWLVDIDGTLALMHDGGRGPFEWDRVGEDQPNPAVIRLTTAIANQMSVIIMSGRDEICREATTEWLHANGIVFDELHMRPAGDFRRDSVVKAELFARYVAPHWAVQGVLDDRQQVVDMWRAMGLMCAQVAPGDF